MSLLLSLLLAAVAVALWLRATHAAGPRTSRRMAHVAGYQSLGRRDQPADAAELEPEGARGVRAAEAIGRRLLPHVGAARVAALRTQLRAAGLYDLTAEAFFGAQAAATGSAMLLALWFGVASGLAPAVCVLFAAFTCFVGFAIPATLVSRRGRLRTVAIDRQMPELVDLLVVAIEAGLALGAALDRAAVHMDGALAGELRLVLQEQGLGATSAEALEHLVERSDTPAVRTFVRTLVQGERLGVPIGQTMRSIALDMRKRRRAAAEELAQKAPVKILFPLVFCIFPALLIVILAPAGLTLMDGFGNG